MPLFNQPRTGKTRTALAFAEKQQFKRVLVVVLNPFLPAWEREMKVAGFEALSPVYLTEGPVIKRAEQLKTLITSKQPAIVYVNYDAWWRGDLRAMIRAWQPELVVYDEAHRLITRGNRSARFAHQIAVKEKWYNACLPMTATWQERGYEDIFSLYQSCDPTVFGTDYLAFQTKYCIVAVAKCMTCRRLLGEDNYLPYCGDGRHIGPLIPWGKYQQIVGYKNLDELFAKIHATSFFLSQDELDIPAPEVTVLPVTLTPATRKLYNKLQKEWAIELQSSSVTLDRAITLLTKAQELTSGFVYDDNGEAVYTSHEKIDLAIEIARNETHAGHQHALYSRFLPDIARLADELKIPRDMTYSSFAGSGEAGRTQRKKILHSLEQGNLPYLIGNIDMVSLGLDLSACRTATYMAVGLSRTDFYQTNCRLQAVGHYPENFVLQACDTVDSYIFDMLMHKDNLASKVHEKASPSNILDILKHSVTNDAFATFIVGG